MRYIQGKLSCVLYIIINFYIQYNFTLVQAGVTQQYALHIIIQMIELDTHVYLS